MPFSAGLHYGIMSGPFVILRFPLNGDGRASEPPTVYVDGFTGDLYLDKAKEIDRYDEAFNGMWLAALDEQASQIYSGKHRGRYSRNDRFSVAQEQRQ